MHIIKCGMELISPPSGSIFCSVSAIPKSVEVKRISLITTIIMREMFVLGLHCFVLFSNIFFHNNLGKILIFDIWNSH